MAFSRLWMSWLWFINRRLHDTRKNTFQGIAQTRQKIIESWVDTTWAVLDSASQRLGLYAGAPEANDIRLFRQQLPDCTEIALINPATGMIIASCIDGRAGKPWEQAQALARSSKADRRPFLHGPYIDPVTLALGPSTSAYHDAVSLMFYHPLKRADGTWECLAARVPNDVLADLIQRENGHVFKQSGDNYLFMAESRQDPSIKPGTALSRSRFEDDKVTPGESLRLGIDTGYGTVRVRNHTEFELILNNPVDNQLQTGLASTIRNGRNVDVAHPGYKDYRNVPVVGAGVRFQVNGSDDVWGLMCEADFVEAYQDHSLARRSQRITLPALAAALAAGLYLPGIVDGSLLWAAMGTVWLTLAVLVSQLGLAPICKRINRLQAYFLDLSEGTGSLSKPIEGIPDGRDEIAALARWVNSFISRTDLSLRDMTNGADALRQMHAEVDRMADILSRTSVKQASQAAAAAAATEQMTQASASIAEQSFETKAASQTALELSMSGLEVVNHMRCSMTDLAGVVSDSSERTQELDKRWTSISAFINVIDGITEQTNMLALNAAIEAARAGDAGRGFAIVADEVRQLANRSAAAARDIGTEIESMRKELHNSVEDMNQAQEQAAKAQEISEQASEALVNIRQGAENTLTLVDNIATATEEQRLAGAEIAENLTDISDLANKNQEEVSQVGLAATKLQQLSINLNQSVSRFVE